MSAMHNFKDTGPLTCAAEGCDKVRGAGRYCHMHAGRLQRNKTLEKVLIRPEQLRNMTPLGLNLTALRIGRGWSVRNICERAKISHVTFWKMCNGGGVRLDTIQTLATLLNVETWELLKPDQFLMPNVQQIT
jgi:DNA-binding Xre family transcriptional regulator